MPHCAIPASCLAALLLASAAFAQGGSGGGGLNIPDTSPERREAPNRRPPVRDDVSTPAADLRPKWETGDTSRLVITIRSRSSVVENPKPDPCAPKTVMPPGPPGQIMDQELTLLEKVTKVDADGNATVEMVYERVKVKLQSEALGDFEFDSTAPPPGKPNRAPSSPGGAMDQAVQEALRPTFQGLVGTKLTLVYDKDGNIVSSSGGGNAGLPGLMGSLGLGGAGLPADPKALGNLFGPISSVRKGGQDPSKLRPGDKWTNTDQLGIGPLGNVRLKTTHTLQSHSGGRARVSFNGMAETDTSGAGSPVKLDAAKFIGEYVWDTRRGRLVSMQTEQETALSTGGNRMVSSTTSTVERQDARR